MGQARGIPQNSNLGPSGLLVWVRIIGKSQETGLVVRALKILVAAGVVAVAGLGTSAPASAAANPSIVSVTCVGPGGGCDASKFSASSVIANPGDAFTVYNGTNVAVLFSIGSSIFPAQTLAVGSGLSGSMTAPSAVGSYTLSIPEAGGASIPLTVTNDPVAPAHADGTAPQPVLGLQQVGVPASGDCADVPVSVGHDQGFPIGGWSKSWANWTNNGTGGAVCTRTVEEIPNGPGTYRLVVNP